ncbi:hypothetical protein NE235_10710 [Actinoallomurus spadix]|uniref:Head-to-tail connector protein n=1 Tax=Actinoallomurus spadix TaxID=79912 RepID=A0ABN0WVK4_9ACTN|nr:hypothetical protein [Actinoallomurus spadix]MCO5986573.1 hypothetical protein [Actinoallomurus spadix]
MNTVKIVHPEAGEADVPASAVPHWRAAGWVSADEARADQDQAEPDPDDGPRKKEDKPSGRSRRRSNEESE